MTKIIKSERELESIQKNLEYQNKDLKVFLVDILPQKCCTRENMQDRMEEMENLVKTFWWIVILEHIQKRWLPDYNTYIWEWKLDEIISEMKIKKANLLIFWNILKIHQIYKVNEKLKEIWAKAWDRVDLILKIFEKNAKTKESKLQIELASIKHMWPRIFWMWMELSKQWAWTWTRWKWETNTEIMKRHLRKKQENIKKELENFKKVRQNHRTSRQKKWLKTIWVVGYTNAWKSTLTNILTKKWVLAEDKLFATLWTSVWKMFISSEELGEKYRKKFNIEEYRWLEVLVNDTIWFIRDLPPELIDAFASTLEDSIESDLLLLVVDSSDKKLEEKIEIVEKILDKIKANQKRIYVFNKIDNLDKKEFIIKEFDEKNNEFIEKKYKNKQEYLKQKYFMKKPVFISAYKNIWLENLKQRILEDL